jgi:hypothetical protein
MMDELKRHADQSGDRVILKSEHKHDRGMQITTYGACIPPFFHSSIAADQNLDLVLINFVESQV